MSSCLFQDSWSAEWPQGFSLPCTCMWTLVVVLAVACSADLCESLPCTDYCFGHHICSWSLWITALVAYFAHLVPNTSHPPHQSLAKEGIRLAKYLQWDSAGWWLLEALVPMVPTNPWQHQFPSSLIENEFIHRPNAILRMSYAWLACLLYFCFSLLYWILLSLSRALWRILRAKMENFAS